MAMGSVTPSVWNIREDQIQRHELLGSGSFGAVYRITWTKDNGEEVIAAGKYFRPLTDEDAIEAEKEARVLSEIDHPNIIKYYGAVRGERDTILVTEYAAGGSLQSHLKKCHTAKRKLPISQALKWANEAALALEYLRSKNLSHRDVKSNNFVITGDGVLKLCDFGFTTEFSATFTTRRKKGTLVYKSPELLKDGMVSLAVDVYAFGIVLWELLTCEKPYEGCNSDRVRCMALDKQRPPMPYHCSITVKMLLKQCWSQSRDDRLDMGEAVCAIEKERRSLQLTDALDEEIELNDMVFHEQLGEGGYGTINRVTFKKPFKGYTEAAAKSIQSLRKEEIEIMRKLRHPNIVTLLAFYQKGPINMIIIELAENRSLHDYLSDMSKPLPGLQKCCWMKEAAFAIDYLHNRNFLHRDIKGSNCLLFEHNLLKLCDFGLARSIHHSQSSSSIKGIYRYMAPEIIKANDQERGLYSKPGDMYAYGMLMLEIETRKQPFDGVEWQTVIYNVGKGKQPTIPDRCPQSLSTLMRRCWSMDPKQRPTTKDIITELVQVESDFASVQ